MLIAAHHAHARKQQTRWDRRRAYALFAGCDEGAEVWACIASLIETCRLNGVDPEAYLADVLEKLVGGWPASRIDELMPWATAFTRHGHIEDANQRAA